METKPRKRVIWDKIKQESDRFDQSEFWPRLRQDEEDVLVDWLKGLRSVAEVESGEEEMED